MIIIVGLGNPGKKYIHTRHNIGAHILTQFAQEFHWQNFKLNKTISAKTSKKNNVLLAIPTTFMNESGNSVKKIMAHTPIPDLWVIHDDIDLPLGKIKISKNRSSAGHKGVQSIIDELGTQNFIRFRIGIIHPRSSLRGQSPKQSKKNVEKFVLEKFSKNEQKIVHTVIQTTTNAIASALENGVEHTMSKYNI